MKLTRRSL